VIVPRIVLFRCGSGRPSTDTKFTCKERRSTFSPLPECSIACSRALEFMLSVMRDKRRTLAVRLEDGEGCCALFTSPPSGSMSEASCFAVSRGITLSEEAVSFCSL
jgi:hypothetical protein